MNKIIYRKGNLFKNIGNDTVLVHSCNAQGSWGKGIALEFKKQFPEAYEDYYRFCNQYKRNRQTKLIVGIGAWFGYPRGKQRVGCLFTSNGYGKYKDDERTILKNTKRAIESLLFLTPEIYTIHSSKINSGLFEVPWEKTEKVIEECLTKYPKHRWIVWSLDDENE